MAKKVVDDQRRADLERLRDWCIAIIQFFHQTHPSTEIYTGFKKVTEATFQRGDLRGLKMIASDVREWPDDLPPDEWERLDRELRERFGWGLSEEVKKFLQEVERILRRGRIESDDEYGLLQSRIDEIYADDSKREELDRIGELQFDYHDRIVKP